MRTIAYRLLASLLVATFTLLPWQEAASQEPQPGAAPLAPMVEPKTNLSPSALFNTNLVPDGDAENTNFSTYWHDNEGFTQILAYGTSCGAMCNFPGPYDVGPTIRGTHFWFMGITSNHSNGNNLWINNKIALAPIQSAIDSGRVRYILSGYFGGDTTLPATAQLHMFFENGSGGSKGEQIVGNVTPADRGNKTGLLYREKTGTIPAGTQFINLAVQTGAINPAPNNYRTGYADNLSLVLLPIQVYLPADFKPAVRPAAQNGLSGPDWGVRDPQRPDPHGHLLDRQLGQRAGFRGAAH